MAVVIENKDAFKSWLTETLSPICDADPKALAKYVLALIVKKDQSEKEIRKLCSDQLEVFLQRDTERFIDKLFYTIKYKDYLKDTSKEPSKDSSSRDRKRDRSPRRRSRSRDRGDRRRRSRSRERRRRSRSRDRRSRSRSPRRKSSDKVNTHRAQSRSPPRSKTTKTSQNGSSKKRDPCTDYHEKGYCLAGDQCTFDHGEDAISIDSAKPPPLPNMSLPPVPPNMPPPPHMIPPGMPPIPPFGLPPVPPVGIPPFAPPNMPPPVVQGLTRTKNGNAPGQISRTVLNPQQGCSLEVRKIPVHENTIQKLNDHFSKFGQITNIQVAFGHPENALVQFASAEMANRAYQSPEPVLNNRFVRVFFYRPPPAQVQKGNIGQRVARKRPNSENAEETTAIDETTIGEIKRTVTNVTVEEPKIVEEARNKQKEKRSEAVQKSIDLRNQYTGLLEGQQAEQKMLIKMLEKGNLGPKKRQVVLDTLKQLTNSIDQRRSSIKALERDIELSERRQAKAELRRPRSQRFAQTATLDRRPRQLRITGFKESERDECITHFAQFGEIADISFEEEGVTMIVEYRTRQQAESAENRGKSFNGRQLVLVWHKQEEGDGEDDQRDEQDIEDIEDINDTLDLESTLDSAKPEAEAEEEEVLAAN
ncbi:Oidioi.mRNA.OKI2018_I69.XSR.g15243.t1.cds [Oikopleura dioica]|uniref:Oidioi.mRNA.OKI2018_I69.XSR.g15243.t1.cds n=1 Tax=Oikopleura dioica TaxID=34765 RepID=A0ABN7SGA7_OIKDI|nr:Oidioi.mRNA.OKI2018_I69.XSR.g15243.t1.cds [Oikopleura dioica]